MAQVVKLCVLCGRTTVQLWNISLTASYFITGSVNTRQSGSNHLGIRVEDLSFVNVTYNLKSDSFQIFKMKLIR